MLDHVCIFSKTGLVLWSQTSKALTSNVVDFFIQSVLLEDRVGASGTSSLTHDEYVVKCTIDTQHDLVFLAVYKKVLALAYVDELLAAVKNDFVTTFAAALARCKPRIAATDVAQFDYATQFADIQRAVEDVRSAASRPGERKAPRRFGDTEKGRQAGKKSANATPIASPTAVKPNAAADATADETSEADLDDGLSDAERRQREVQRNIEKMRAKRAGAGSAAKVRSPPTSDTKKPRGWDDSTSAKDAAKLDLTGATGQPNAAAEEAKIAKLRAELGVGQQFDLEFEVESDDAATAAAERASQSAAGGFWSYVRKLTGGAPLTATDLAPVLSGFRDHLVTKNVASEIADKLCASVAATLTGKTLGSFASVSNAVRESMDEAMTRILTPKRTIDILRDVRAAQRERRPYSIVFVGVNGVGKCLARNTKILMFDGSVKRVQHVRVGDRVMGDDGSWRRVLSTTSGREQMARIALRKAATAAAVDDDEESFVCNMSHVLSLRCAPTVHGVERCGEATWRAYWHTTSRVSPDDSVVDAMLLHSSAVFASAPAAAAFLEHVKETDVAFCDVGAIVDISVRDHLALPTDVRAHLLAYRTGALEFARQQLPIEPATVGYLFASDGDVARTARKFTCAEQELQQLVATTSTLPRVYTIGDCASRRALLRGIMDGARRVSESEIELPTESLAQDALFVARSLGMRAARRGCVLELFTEKDTGFGEPFSVVVLPDAEYFGFALNGNHRFVLASSLLVTHNSTSLAKVSSWLQQNKLSILIAACDTFRSGAVEQLRVHSRCINVELFERGYNKDAAAVAADAVAEAHAKGVDVVVIDTAGRMQDNEPLMRSLAKLVSRNQPDLILFVGEALVGNEAVDQVVKFNDALKVFAPTPAEARQIDGIILTKFDTIDDKVGAAVSMAYTVGAPVVFVGTGQHYTDLKTLNVRAIVRALLK